MAHGKLNPALERALYGVFVAYVLAWFLPAAGDSPGWVAYMATAPLLFDKWHIERPAQLAAMISPHTNYLVIFLLLWRFRKGTARAARLLAWWYAGGFALNAVWLFGDQPSLGIGYFTWWVSFLAFAVVLGSLARDQEADERAV
jgi:hypothetical protein